MAEHVLRGEFAIYPRAEGGRQFVMNDLGEMYRIPLTDEMVERLVHDLSLSTEDLEAELARRQAGTKLIKPSANGIR